MNIGWLSASPSATTGYGTQTLEVCKRLMARHNVVCIGQVGDTVVWGGRQELPMPNGQKLKIIALAEGVSAANVIDKYYVPEFNLDVIVGFMDAFALEYLNDLKTPVVGWIPIDGYFTDKWRNYLRNYYKIFTYSRFGYDELKKWFPPSKIGYIPHGIPEEFRPRDKAAIREKLGIRQDAFLICNVGANIGPRKELPLLMKTFAKFSKTHKDAYLVMHTNPTMPFPRGYDLISWRRYLGIEDRCFFPKYDPILAPTSTDELSEIYSMCDVYVQNSVAEGFGLPIAEAMRCGTPAIAPMNSSQTELIGFKGDRGWLTSCIDEDDYVQVPNYVPMMTQYPVPSQKSLLEQLENAYKSPDERIRRGLYAREYIVENHSWKKVMDGWFSQLQQISEELDLYKKIRLAISQPI